MFGHLHHEFWALQLGMPTRPVFDFRGRGQLATHFNTRDQNRFEVGSSGIERRSVASRAGAKHDETMVLGIAHIAEAL
jgi:hypothetical protein